jgi:hypothetical protein
MLSLSKHGGQAYMRNSFCLNLINQIKGSTRFHFLPHLSS